MLKKSCFVTNKIKYKGKLIEDQRQAKSHAAFISGAAPT